jgi:pyrroline-5-carboxylate reductase
MAPITQKLSFIGGGHITDIIVENLLREKVVSTNSIFISDPDREKLQTLCAKHSVSKAKNNVDAVHKGEFVFINVRPNVVSEVIAEFANVKPFPNRVIISVAAGITINSYNHLSDTLPVVRALPNPPSQFGMGIAALCFNRHVTRHQQKNIFTIFSALGECVTVDESMINAITALSSPAPVLLFFQSLIEAGASNGLDRVTAEKVALQTIIGVMGLYKKRDATPEDLLREACTPGGISEASVASLKEQMFSEVVKRAIAKGTHRADSFST